MAAEYWERVQRTGFAVPTDRPLSDLTAELTEMLGSPDAAVRDGTAHPALATWIRRGVYDDLLGALGDGMAIGLRSGIGEQGTDSVFRRSFSALTLAACLERDNVHRLLPGTKVLEWGDHLATWFLAERDTRGHVDDKGWAHAIAHGADALGVLARSPHCGSLELTVILDVLAERLVMESAAPLTSGEPDRIALATMSVLRRNVLELTILEPWIATIAGAANSHDLRAGDPYLRAADAQAFLRALFLQLSLASDPPLVRADLVLVLIEALRATNAEYLPASAASVSP